MAASTVLGVFAHVDTATRAIRELRARGMRSIATYSPVPLDEFEEALTGHGLPRSPVRLFTLVGALTGTASGFALTIWTALKWDLITGGKPVVSIPPFVVIAFEMTILWADSAPSSGCSSRPSCPASACRRSTIPGSARIASASR